MTTRKANPTSPTKDTVDGGVPLVSLDAAMFSGVTVKIDAQLGSVAMTVQELLALRAGEVVTLEAALNDLIELHLNGSLVGRGEIVAVGDSFGVRIVDLASPA